MKVLVTGASGFSGSWVARATADAGHEVTALYRTESRFLQSLAGDDRIDAVCRDLGAVSTLSGRYDAVVHVAATSPAKGVDVDRIVHDNVAGTHSLLRAAQVWESRAFVLFSSLSLYGTVSTDVVDEETPIVDPDAYGASKLLCELLLADRSASLPGLSLRLPGVLGPGAHRNWLSGVASTLLARKRLTAYRLEHPFNNAVHVSDIVRLVVRVLSSSWKGFDAVVLGARDSMSVGSVVRRLAAGLGCDDPEVVEVPATQPHFILSSRRALEHWGYEPMPMGQLLDTYARDVIAWSKVSDSPPVG